MKPLPRIAAAVILTGSVLTAGAASSIAAPPQPAAHIANGFPIPGYTTREFRLTKDETRWLAQQDTEELSQTASTYLSRFGFNDVAILVPLIRKQSAQAAAEHSCIALGVGTAPQKKPIPYVVDYHDARNCPT